jgi:hypothetical protein
LISTSTVTGAVTYNNANLVGAGHIWQVVSATEMMLKANQLIFESGATDPTLDWSHDGILNMTQGSLEIQPNYTGGLIVGGSPTGGFVHRSSDGWDFNLSDFTTDTTWRDLDLSSIVPVGAKAVLINVRIKDDAVYSYFMLRKNGDTGNNTEIQTYTAIAWREVRTQPIIAVDSGRVIEYNAEGGGVTWLNIDMRIAGWFI